VEGAGRIRTAERGSSASPRCAQQVRVQFEYVRWTGAPPLARSDVHSGVFCEPCDGGRAMSEIDAEAIFSRYRYEYVSPVLEFGPITAGQEWEIDFSLANRGRTAESFEIYVIQGGAHTGDDLPTDRRTSSPDIPADGISLSRRTPGRGLGSPLVAHLRHITELGPDFALLRPGCGRADASRRPPRCAVLRPARRLCRLRSCSRSHAATDRSGSTDDVGGARAVRVDVPLLRSRKAQRAHVPRDRAWKEIGIRTL
jgi:hypothetical protein